MKLQTKSFVSKRYSSGAVQDQQRSFLKPNRNNPMAQTQRLTSSDLQFREEPEFSRTQQMVSPKTMMSNPGFNPGFAESRTSLSGASSNLERFREGILKKGKASKKSSKPQRVRHDCLQRVSATSMSPNSKRSRIGLPPKSPKRTSKKASFPSPPREDLIRTQLKPVQNPSESVQDLESSWLGRKQSTQLGPMKVLVKENQEIEMDSSDDSKSPSPVLGQFHALSAIRTVRSGMHKRKTFVTSHQSDSQNQMLSLMEAMESNNPVTQPSDISKNRRQLETPTIGTLQKVPQSRYSSQNSFKGKNPSMMNTDIIGVQTLYEKQKELFGTTNPTLQSKRLSYFESTYSDKLKNILDHFNKQQNPSQIGYWRNKARQLSNEYLSGQTHINTNTSQKSMSHRSAGTKSLSRSGADLRQKCYIEQPVQKKPDSTYEQILREKYSPRFGVPNMVLTDQTSLDRILYRVKQEKKELEHFPIADNKLKRAIDKSLRREKVNAGIKVHFYDALKDPSSTLVFPPTNPMKSVQAKPSIASYLERTLKAKLNVLQDTLEAGVQHMTIRENEDENHYLNQIDDICLKLHQTFPKKINITPLHDLPQNTMGPKDSNLTTILATQVQNQSLQFSPNVSLLSGGGFVGGGGFIGQALDPRCSIGETNRQHFQAIGALNSLSRLKNITPSRERKSSAQKVKEMKPFTSKSSQRIQQTKQGNQVIAGGGSICEKQVRQVSQPVKFQLFNQFNQFRSHRGSRRSFMAKKIEPKEDVSISLAAIETSMAKEESLQIEQQALNNSNNASCNQGEQSLEDSMPQLKKKPPANLSSLRKKLHQQVKLVKIFKQNKDLEDVSLQQLEAPQTTEQLNESQGGGGVIRSPIWNRIQEDLNNPKLDKTGNNKSIESFRINSPHPSSADPQQNTLPQPYLQTFEQEQGDSNWNSADQHPFPNQLHEEETEVVLGKSGDVGAFNSMSFVLTQTVSQAPPLARKHS